MDSVNIDTTAMPQKLDISCQSIARDVSQLKFERLGLMGEDQDFSSSQHDEGLGIF
jgi:hypothetical protein